MDSSDPKVGTVLDRHPELPLDPDAAAPLHLRPGALALVALGGTVGTAAREALSLAVPDLGRVPVAILLINLTGAFALGVLMEALARRGEDRGVRRRIRLLLGTGFLGGYTTYSALAEGAARLLGDGAIVQGLGYALATVLIGGLASWLGIVVASAHHRRNQRGER